MYSSLKRGLYLVTVIGTVSLSSFNVQAKEFKYQIEELLPGVEENEILLKKKEADQAVSEEKGEYFKMVFADVSSFLYVRSEPTKESEYVGKLYPGAAATITGSIGEWTPIESGEVTGYVKTEYILTGEEARVYDEKLKAENTEYTFAVSRQAETNILQDKRKEVVDYACQFIGNPYVWGGTSLTQGADCSGFVQSVYSHFGVAMPRTSYEQRTAGREVSYSEAIPGDVICYDGHVGIYIGEGKIVNAMNPEQGIGISPAEYTTILSVRRII